MNPLTDVKINPADPGVNFEYKNGYKTIYSKLANQIEREFEKYNYDCSSDRKPLMYDHYSYYDESAYKNTKIQDSIKEVEEIAHRMQDYDQNYNQRMNYETISHTSPEGYHNYVLQSILEEGREESTGQLNPQQFRSSETGKIYPVGYTKPSIPRSNPQELKAWIENPAPKQQMTVNQTFVGLDSEIPKTHKHHIHKHKPIPQCKPLDGISRVSHREPQQLDVIRHSAHSRRH
jgi:hypothetical protein